LSTAAVFKEIYFRALLLIGTENSSIFSQSNLISEPGSLGNDGRKPGLEGPTNCTSLRSRPAKWHGVLCIHRDNGVAGCGWWGAVNFRGVSKGWMISRGRSRQPTSRWISKARNHRPLSERLACFRRHHPILAVLHLSRSEHLWAIPNLIRSIAPEYNLFLRRYAEECWEGVCYAIPDHRLKRA